VRAWEASDPSAGPWSTPGGQRQPGLAVSVADPIYESEIQQMVSRITGPFICGRGRPVALHEGCRSVSGPSAGSWSLRERRVDAGIAWPTMWRATWFSAVPGSCWWSPDRADRAASWPETEDTLTRRGLRVSSMSKRSRGRAGPSQLRPSRCLLIHAARGSTHRCASTRRMPRLICGLDCLGGGLDELGYVARVGDHRHVARWDLDGGGTHALGELALGVRRDRLIVLSDQVPGWV
jgi:hypothetical protein